MQFAKVPKDTHFSNEEIAALRSMFSHGPSSAERERARALRVERTWRARAARVAADSCISMEIEGLAGLLRDVERSRDQKLLQPGNFVLGRMYGESPFTVRTDTLSEGGHVEGEASTAKVMGAQLRFAFTCFTSKKWQRAVASRPHYPGGSVLAADLCYQLARAQSVAGSPQCHVVATRSVHES